MTGLRGFAAGVLVAGVLSPSLAMNVWPRLSQMLERGTADPHDAGVAAFYVVSVLLMAACPHAFAKARGIGSRVVIVVAGFAFATLNLGNAIETSSMVRDDFADPRRDTIAKAAGLDAQITAALAERVKLPHPAVPTTPAMVEAASAAVDAAATVRTRECGTRTIDFGDKCRGRADAEAAARVAHAAALADLSRTQALATADTEVAALRAAREALGAVPTHADPFASRLADMLGLVFTVSADAISKNWPTWLGIGVELAAAFGPMMVLLLLEPVRAPLAPAAAPESKAPETASDAAPAPNAAAVRETPASPARPKKSRPVKARAATVAGDVREWKQCRTVDRPGSRVRCGEAYASYSDWCRERNAAPVSLTAFGLAMKNDLGVGFEDKNKRSFYVGVALVGGIRVVSAAG